MDIYIYSFLFFLTLPFKAKTKMTHKIVKSNVIIELMKSSNS